MRIDIVERRVGPAFQFRVSKFTTCAFPLYLKAGVGNLQNF